MATTDGIDVSKWNNLNGSIDWDKVKNSGIKFVIIRAGYGREISQKDPYFEENYKGAKTAGLLVGAYWYTYATSTDRAKKEAQVCLEAISGKTFDFPVYYDIEYESSILALTNSVRTSLCKTFCDTIKAGGFTPGIYCSTAFAKSYLNMSSLSAYALWIAQYNSKCTYSGTYDMWQYTDVGKVSGITGNVDMNHYYGDIASSSSSTASSSSSASKPSYTTGNTYTLQAEMIVRKGPGKSYAAVGYSGLTSDGKKHDSDKDGALDKGTVVTCKGITANGDDLWMKIPSGYVAAYYSGKIYIK